MTLAENCSSPEQKPKLLTFRGLVSEPLARLKAGVMDHPDSTGERVEEDGGGDRDSEADSEAEMMMGEELGWNNYLW